MAGKTEYIPVSGKVKWFRHIKPDTKYDPPRWRHVMYPVQESLNTIRDLQSEGVKNILHKDEDGFFINWSRPTQIKINGEYRGLAPPMVTLGDEKTPYQGNVGNGSDVTTVLEVYKHRVPNSQKMAKAARWLSSRIDNLVPFDDTSYNPDEINAVSPLQGLPKPTW